MMRRLALASLLVGAPALAYEPVTHAGLTERAALRASLHRVLVDELGLALGLYEPLTLHRATVADRELQRRLDRLDPEGGYSADDGRQTALGWLAAGSVLEGVPADRNRNHFYDPTSGAGLHDLDGGSKLRTRINDVGDGLGSIRGIFTGTNFDGTGRPAIDWLVDERNDWGVRRYLDERQRAATARMPSEREDALVRSLLAAGAVLHVVEDMGDPPYVRNDFRVALEADGAAYEHLVARRYGRMGIPESGGAAPERAHLTELVHDRSGGGLADRTNRRFFSDGTLPGSERYAEPTARPGDAMSGYASSDAVAHLARFDRTPNGVVWSLDERCLVDYAEALLPETARYAEAALRLLYRGRLTLTPNGSALEVRLAEPALGAGTVALYADTAAGERRLVVEQRLGHARAGDALVSAARPSWARHATAVFRGVDEQGEPLVLVEEQPLP